MQAQINIILQIDSCIEDSTVMLEVFMKSDGRQYRLKFSCTKYKLLYFSYYHPENIYLKVS